MKRRVCSFVAVGLVLIAGLLALELGFRLLGRAIEQRSWQRGVMAPDPDRGWIGRPHPARWVDTGELRLNAG